MNNTSKGHKKDSLETKMKKSESKNFGLSEEQFNSLVAQLKKGNDLLFKKIFFSHFESCRKYLMIKDNAREEDAYDASMDAMLEFFHRLRAGKIKYGNLRFLFTLMARQCFLSQMKKSDKEIFLTDIALERLAVEEKITVPSDMRAAFDKAWDKLKIPCKELLHKFYYQKQAFKEIATELDKSEAAVRKQKQRCLEMLQSTARTYYKKN